MVIALQSRSLATGAGSSAICCANQTREAELSLCLGLRWGEGRVSLNSGMAVLLLASLTRST